MPKPTVTKRDFVAEHVRGIPRSGIRDFFEVVQSMKDPPLTACPRCGKPIQRAISVCAVSTTQSAKSMLSDKNLKEKGFTKLVNEGGGKFRKTT